MTKLVSTQELREAAARYRGYAASWAENAQAQETAAYREHAQVMARQYEADAVLIAAAAEQVDAAQRTTADALQEMEQARRSHEVTLGELDAAQQQIAALKLHIKDETAFADQLLDAQQQIAALTEANLRSIETPLPPTVEEEVATMARLLREKDTQIAALTAERGEARAAVEDLCHQFAYDYGGPTLGTGGLSALEGAFSVLGWDDPHPIPGSKCAEATCGKRASCGTPTPEGYKWFCGDHYRNAVKALDKPLVDSVK